MSSHFNYEIEERNMRDQLKGLKIPFKEEAWLSYETYAKQFHNVHKTHLLSNFNFALNRTVILPVVFGCIIILFSFLLFNFINIKNTKPVVSKISQVSQPIIETPQSEPKKKIIIPVKKEAPKNIVAKTIIAEPIKDSVQIAEVKKPAIDSTSTNPIANITEDSHITKTTPAHSVKPKRKRHRRGSADVLETISTPINLPTTVTQADTELELK